MSITYPLSLPASPKPQKMRLSGKNLVAATQSPFTGSFQVQLWPGEFWILDMTLPPIKDRDVAEQWQTVLLSLRGMFGTFESPADFSYTGPRGAATGTPLVNGTNTAQAVVLNTKGWTANVTGIMKAGDYLQVQVSGSFKRLYKVMKDVNSDASGHATLDIWPRLRETLSDGLSVVISNPMGTFQLTSNQRDFDIDEAGFFSFDIQAVEAI